MVNPFLGFRMKKEALKSGDIKTLQNLAKKNPANSSDLAFEKYLKSGSGHAFAKRHFW